MKHLITAIALTAICFTVKAGDTIPVKEKYVMIKYSKHGRYHKVPCEYIVKKQGYYTDTYYVNGRPLQFIKHVENDTITAKN